MQDLSEELDKDSAQQPASKKPQGQVRRKQGEQSLLHPPQTLSTFTCDAALPTVWTKSAENDDGILGLSVLLPIQRDIAEVLAIPEMQEYFDQIAERCFPDMEAYRNATKPILDQIEAPILVKHGVAKNEKRKHISLAQERMRQGVEKWSEVVEVNKLLRNYLSLTRLNQVWKSTPTLR